MDLSDWTTVESELARDLGPVAAPDALWDRIERGRPPRAKPSLTWPIAAALTLVAASGGLWWLHGTPAGLEDFAVTELHADPGLLDLHSDDPGEIRRWVKAQVGIDLELPARRPTGEIRLLGVRLMERKGAPVAAVAYRVGRANAALLVSRANGAGEGEHRLTRSHAGRGVPVFSWRMREQVYILACSLEENPQEACLLCHAGGRHSVAVN